MSMVIMKICFVHFPSHANSYLNYSVAEWSPEQVADWMRGIISFQRSVN